MKIKNGEIEMVTDKQKELTIGTDYADICGYDPAAGQHIVYMGGIRFALSMPGKSAEAENQTMYDKIKKYINQPSVSMGTDTIGR